MFCYITSYVLVLLIGILIGYIFTKQQNTQISKIHNTNKKNMEDDYYYLIKDSNNDKTSYLFTEEQMGVAKKRAINNPEDIN